MSSTGGVPSGRWPSFSRCWRSARCPVSTSSKVTTRAIAIGVPPCVRPTLRLRRGIVQWWASGLAQLPLDGGDQSLVQVEQLSEEPDHDQEIALPVRQRTSVLLRTVESPPEVGQISAKRAERRPRHLVADQ